MVEARHSLRSTQAGLLTCLVGGAEQKGSRERLRTAYRGLGSGLPGFSRRRNAASATLPASFDHGAMHARCAWVSTQWQWQTTPLPAPGPDRRMTATPLRPGPELSAAIVSRQSA